MHPQLRDLLQVHTSGLIGDIHTLAQMADRNFEQDLYPLWVRVDERIPGPGLQYAYWKQGDWRIGSIDARHLAGWADCRLSGLYGDGERSSRM